MTLTANVVGDIHAVDNALGDAHPESDVGFFSMSSASAEQVTVQISTGLERAWEYIALAYKGRAFATLGYPSWDAYVEARFGEFRIAVPREHRAHAVATLAGVRLSVRAIAKLLGVGVGTVHREMVGLSGVPDGTPDLNGSSTSTLGRDGKKYPRRRKPAIATCPTCGEQHLGDPDICPWDLFAQGIGPRPASPRNADADDDIAQAGQHGGAHPAQNPQPTTEAPDETPDQVPPADNAAPDGASVSTAVERAECLLGEITDLPSVVTGIESAVKFGPTDTDPNALAARVRALGDWLQEEFGRVPDLVDRLGRVAEDLQRR